MKVAIVGTCPSSRMLAVQLPPEWQLWVCSPGNDDCPRINLWFELHGDLDAPWEDGRLVNYINWVNGLRCPVMAQRLDLFPKAKRFPYEELVGQFGDHFFTSQPAWMMAYAIQQKATDIVLFGLDMSAKSEYSHQKPSIAHFADLAKRQGINVSAPLESDVLIPPPLYGYSYNNPMAYKLRVRQLEIAQKLRQVDADIQRLESLRNHFRGVLDENDWVQQTWTGGIHTDNGSLVRVPAPQGPQGD